jgi:hypothetical protein
MMKKQVTDQGIPGVCEERIDPMEEQLFESPPVQVRILLRPQIGKENVLLAVQFI